MPPVMLQPCRDQCPRREHPHIAETLLHTGTGVLGCLAFCSKQFILCLHANADILSKSPSQADRLCQTEQLLLFPPKIPGCSKPLGTGSVEVILHFVLL